MSLECLSDPGSTEICVERRHWRQMLTGELCGHGTGGSRGCHHWHGTTVSSVSVSREDRGMFVLADGEKLRLFIHPKTSSEIGAQCGEFSELCVESLVRSDEHVHENGARDETGREVVTELPGTGGWML